MQGEIMVAEVMAREARLRVWKQRQDRDAEWAALKQWWRAEEKLRRAKDEPSRLSALADRAKTARLYHAELARAWPKWQHVRAVRWHGASRDESGW